MASRVGSYLSDENIRKMCPLEHMPPGSKTYELFKIASAPDALAQRPQDPKQALRRIALIQNQNYQDLEERYINSLSIIKPEVIGVIPSVPRPNQSASIQASVSRPVLVPTGTGGGGGTGAMPPSFTQEIAQYEPLSKAVQKNIFKEIFNQAQALGIPTGAFRASDIDVSMSRGRRTDTFKRLVEEVQQGSSDADFSANIMASVLSGVGTSAAPVP
tara:strand:- start:1841 stop:2488 length:648 start_codon:yes stop_codon:yes gene_type:complete